MRPNVAKDTTVQVDIHQGSEFIDLDIDLVFPKAPCSGKLLKSKVKFDAVLDIMLKTGYTEKVND